MLQIKDCCLVVVDIQGKLARLMYDKQTLFKNIPILIKAAKILDIPIIWCQQCPQALGETIGQIAELLTDIKPLNKATFSCCGLEQFNQSLRALNRRQIILCGIEAHVCIYQTAVDLLKAGFYVQVVADAVSSRTLADKQTAVQKLKTSAIDISSVEMTLFELLVTADHPKFKPVVELIK